MTLTQEDRLAIPVPKRLRTRPRDKRGYPIPFVVLIDQVGVPQFTINSHDRAVECRSKRLCGLCGKRMDGDTWFIGGPTCFTHEHGAFVDPPSHYECAHYALQVCPFLAAPSYAKRIDLKKMTDDSYGDKVGSIITHDTMPDGQPAVFGLGLPGWFDFLSREQLYVPGDWHYIEWWKDGVTVAAPDRVVAHTLRRQS